MATGTQVPAAAATIIGETLGHCLEDSFTIASPGAVGSPTICGTNTGYHSIEAI